MLGERKGVGGNGPPCAAQGAGAAEVSRGWKVRRHIPLSLGCALALERTQAPEDAKTTTDEDAEAPRGREAQREPERNRTQELERWMLLTRAYQVALPPVTGKPVRRSKRAQRVRERGW